MHRQASHGFSAVPGGTAAGPAWLPQPTWWGGYAVAGEDADAASMLSLYRSALSGRRECRSAMGDRLVWIDDLGDDVVAFDRGTVRVVLNLSGDRLTLPERIVARRRIELASVPDHDDPRVVPADAAVWLV